MAPSIPSPAERLVIDGVEGPADPHWEAAWSSELDRRVRELDSGAVQAVPWEQARSELIARLPRP